MMNEVGCLRHMAVIDRELNALEAELNQMFPQVELNHPNQVHCEKCSGLGCLKYTDPITLQVRQVSCGYCNATGRIKTK